MLCVVCSGAEPPQKTVWSTSGSSVRRASRSLLMKTRRRKRSAPELIVMASYTLGQCRQSSDKESLTPDQKAISKRFKFEEPGDFIYWCTRLRFSRSSFLCKPTRFIFSRLRCWSLAVLLSFSFVSGACDHSLFAMFVENDCCSATRRRAELNVH